MDEAAAPAAATKIATARSVLVGFFERCMGFLAASDPEAQAGKMDAVTSFGCQLFFAGAAEVLTANSRLDAKHLGDVMEPAALALGLNKARLQQFTDKYDSYLLEPGYLDMFRAGREAMQTSLDDERKAAEKEKAEVEAPSDPKARIRSPDDDDFEDEGEADIGIFLAHALEEWKKPKDRKGNLTAVLFTDIVGSTNRILPRSTATKPANVSSIFTIQSFAAPSRAREAGKSNTLATALWRDFPIPPRPSMPPC